MSSKQIKVLHFSTHNENCGIGKYQEMFLEAMDGSEEFHNDFFELSPNQIKRMSPSEYEEAFHLLEKRLQEYDILHIQHEFSFFWTDELIRSVDIAKKLSKKIIVTSHTSPNVAHKRAVRAGLGPRSILNYLRALRQEKVFYKNFIDPIKQVDLLIVHNKVTKKAFTDRGVPEGIIREIVIPVPKVSFNHKTNTIHQELKAGDKDIICSTIGFLHRFKGVKQAVKSLSYLPDNYKLAIIGGLHPDTDDTAIYDKIADLIVKLDLKDRVYITGYVEDDEEMNALIRETDICLYPYDKEYYSNVSSAALNNALANHMPVVAYPTESFKELNQAMPTMVLTQTFAYYELAREIKRINTKQTAENAKKFAEHFEYKKSSAQIEAFYRELL